MTNLIFFQQKINYISIYRNLFISVLLQIKIILSMLVFFNLLILKFVLIRNLIMYFKLNFKVLYVYISLSVLLLSNSSFSQISKQYILVDNQSLNTVERYDVYVEGKLINKDSVFISNLFLKDTFPKKIKIHPEGYKKLSFNQTINDTIIKVIKISPDLKVFKTITIKKRNNLEFGKIDLSNEDISKIPTFLGENDLIKSIQLLPGIQSAGDGNGIYVRGGGMDQNLVLYDDVQLYNFSHLFGFLSVFNSKSISKVRVYKGGTPSNYGGRISSVISIHSQKGDYKKWTGESNLGILASSFMISGPTKKDTSSILFAVRRTYVDLINKSISKNSDYQTEYYFYDVNLNYNLKINKNNDICLSGLLTKDDFIYNDRKSNAFQNNMSWNNKLISMNWNSLIKENLTFHSTLGYVDYDLKFGAGIYNYKLNLFSRIKDFTSKQKFVFKNKNYTSQLGFEYNNHNILPNNFNLDGEKGTKYLKKSNLYSNDYNIFFDQTFIILDKLQINAGLRYVFYNQKGPYSKYFYNSSNQLDSLLYSPNETIFSYQNPEPRIQIEYNLNNQKRIYASFTKMYQYIHLAPVSSISLPTDTWVPSSALIKPQIANQYSIGYADEIKKYNLNFTTELYYKKMENQIEYKDGAMSVLSIQNAFDENFYFGSGESFGIEFLIKKEIGKWDGWMGYTLSKSIRNFDAISDGKTFYAKNDRRHDLSTVINYEYNKRLDFSLVFVFKSGNAMTIPTSRYFIQDNIVNTYGAKNSYRIQPYNRLDISVNYKLKNLGRFKNVINFSIYNIYARQNPFYIYYETAINLKKFFIETKAKQVSLFTILPSISWRCEF